MLVYVQLYYYTTVQIKIIMFLNFLHKYFDLQGASLCFWVKRLKFCPENLHCSIQSCFSFFLLLYDLWYVQPLTFQCLNKLIHNMLSYFNLLSDFVSLPHPAPAPASDFIVEVKKQSSCEIHLSNVSDQYVAFKVFPTYIFLFQDSRNLISCHQHLWSLY